MEWDNPNNEPGYSNGPQYNPGLPQSDSGSSESTTYAVLSEGDIRIGGERTSAQALGIRTQLDGANESVAALPDLQRLLQRQRTVSQASADIIGAAQTYSSNRAKEAERQKQQAERDFRQAKASGDTVAQAEASARIKQAEQTKQEWGVGGSKSRTLQAASTLIVGTLGGQTDMQVAANTLAPYAASAIGKNFGHGENKNETAQVLGHFLLGAALAYVNGADPLSGGSAAIASEKAAEYLAAQYNDGVSYNNEAGEFEPNRLPENVKQEIRAITGAIGTLVGGVSGSAHHGNGNAVDVLTNAQVGGVVGQNAVVNNFVVPIPLPSPLPPPYAPNNQLQRQFSSPTITTPEDEMRRVMMLKPADELFLYSLSYLLNIISSNQGQGSHGGGQKQNRPAKATATQPQQVVAAAGAPMPPDPDDHNNGNNRHNESTNIKEGHREYVEKAINDMRLRNPQTMRGASPGSASQIEVTMSQEEAMVNLERNGFTRHATRSPNTYYLEKGNVRYNFYPRSTGRGMPNVQKGRPSASLFIEGKEVPIKIRFPSIK